MNVAPIKSGNILSLMTISGAYGSSCGYCHNETDSSKRYGAHALKLTCADYQGLIDRGWRRSGAYLYKPEMSTTCCPQYAIRCDSVNFKLHHSHKKTLKKMIKYLQTGKGLDDTEHDTEHDNDNEHDHDHNSDDNTAATLVGVKQKETEPIQENKEETKGTKKGKKGKKDKTPNSSEIPYEQIVAKNKQLKAERRAEKNLESYFTEIFDKSDKKHILEVNLVKPEATEEVFQLYQKYQANVHNEPDSTKRGFTNFLVNSPLSKEFVTKDIELGSYHQHYRIDGKLVAVGVVDILPSCLSAVYFFYDTDYSKLSLGVFSALQELYFTQHNLYKFVPTMRYYYMGYYIHSCVKMRYKAQFAPAWLLCPETYVWVPIQTCLPKLDQSPYCRLNPQLDGRNENNLADLGNVKLSHVWILIQGQVVPLSAIKGLSASGRQHLARFCQLVGEQLSQRIVIAV